MSRVYSYPREAYNSYFDIDLPAGTQRIVVTFHGPEDDLLSRPQYPEVLFLPSYTAARRLNASQYGHELAARMRHLGDQGTAIPLERLFELHRNVVAFWVREDTPADLRAIVRGCLTSRRSL